MDDKTELTISIGKAESLEDAVGKLVHAAKVNGTSIKIPDSTASEEDMAAFMKKVTEIDGVMTMPLSDDEEGMKGLMSKLGTPAEAADYKLPELDGFTWNNDQADTLRKYALEAGMTKGQFEKFANNVAKQEQETGITAETALSDIRKAVRDDWGEATDERTALIRGYLKLSDAPANLLAGLDGKNLDVTTMNWLHEVAKQFKGDVTPISDDGGSPTPTVTRQEALEAIPKILGDLTGMRETDPRYKGLQMKFVDMQRLANPEQAA